LAKARRIPRIKTLRRALGLTQEEFAARYKIPLGTLRDWEQGRSEPDQPARAYLSVIAHDPEGARGALQRGPKPRDLHRKELLKVSETEIRRLADTISEELYQAIAYYETYTPSGLDPALIGRVNRSGIHPGFNVVSEALQLGVITTLCRIWDKTRGSARIAEIARRLRKSPGLVNDAIGLAQWQADVEEIEQSEELDALRGFRNVGLAHKTDPNLLDPRKLGDTRRVVNGDERRALEATISVVSRLNRLIDLNSRLDFYRQQNDWREHANTFWSAVAT
jgi:transcriptional regulator with XRE-family HTH domain